MGDEPLRLGLEERLPCRLLAVRAPQAVADERRRKLRAAAKREGRVPTRERLALCAWTLCSSLANTGADQTDVAPTRGR